MAYSNITAAPHEYFYHKGMIQDWQGAVFIKGAKLDQVLRVVQDYRTMPNTIPRT